MHFASACFRTTCLDESRPIFPIITLDASKYQALVSVFEHLNSRGKIVQTLNYLLVVTQFHDIVPISSNCIVRKKSFFRPNTHVERFKFVF
jgi:hypothetical protein